MKRLWELKAEHNELILMHGQVPRCDKESTRLDEQFSVANLKENFGKSSATP